MLFKIEEMPQVQGVDLRTSNLSVTTRLLSSDSEDNIDDDLDDAEEDDFLLSPRNKSNKKFNQKNKNFDQTS